jgi:hypothetical protein
VTRCEQSMNSLCVQHVLATNASRARVAAGIDRPARLGFWTASVAGSEQGGRLHIRCSLPGFWVMAAWQAVCMRRLMIGLNMLVDAVKLWRPHTPMTSAVIRHVLPPSLQPCTALSCGACVLCQHNASLVFVPQAEA